MNWPLRSETETAPAPSPSAVLAKYADAPPPIDLEEMVRELGLAYECVPLADDISGKLIQDSGARAGFRIVVNALDAEQRRRFTIAHEIAHYVLHRDLIGQGLVDNALYRSSLRDEYERQADALAAKILLPAAAVRAAFRHTKSYAGLAELFHASTTAIRIRLHELGLAA